ncbi:ATPase [Candidatus Syntrophocurvum alkaliphilum]|uniref:ATPase n=1 Tax=Candidatus Syntrophocurvum alkaliphilum TaxID=2293317 RepID=A0A6I6DPY0_9FIRM|nr:energy-coupling factor transporter ATPase [Candidatus Syntrophocurvum alkaliphilum]QGU00808.1 ATPase [Candidatus Syntrophocurvum alkaliphilum]
MIQLDNVSYSYDNKYLALNKIYLHINNGEHVAILGSNGSGKSTLARLLNGLLTPTEGRVIIDGLDTSKPKHNKRIKQKVGLLVSSPDDQIVASIVEEDIAFGPENLGLSPKEIKKRVKNALKMVSMEEYNVYPPNLLSGGQKQKICIAGVLALKPSYLVLDEPTTMLDFKSKKDIINTLLTLNKKENKSLINITHNADEAIFADRAIVLNKGKIVLEGPTKEVLTQSNLLEKLGVEPLDVSKIVENVNNKSKFTLDKSILKDEELVDALCQLK